MKYYDSLSKINPVYCFIYYVGAVILSVIIRHPIFVILTTFSVLIYYFLIKKNNEYRLLKGLLIMVIVIALINPLFNTYGSTEIFTWANGRIYSLEALIYGALIGLMLANILIIFSLYNNVMTNDKFIYIFGNISPGLSLITSMSLNLVPDFKKKIKNINKARAGIGKGVANSSFGSKVAAGSDALISMTNRAFEDGIIRSYSMRARGYGLHKRSSFKRYSFYLKDHIFIIISAICIIYVCLSLIFKGTYVNFYPQIEMSDTSDFWMISGFIVYAVFLWIPFIINMYEVIKWRYLKSKI